MNMKKSILSCLLALGCLAASAQDKQPEIEYVFNPHWFVQIQPGIQHTEGEIAFGKLNSFNIQIAGGRQFTPVVGLRLAVDGFQSKAGSIIEKDYIANEFKWSWTYIAPSIDATFNLSNLVCGYNPTRVFDLSAFLGVGLNIGMSNDDAHKANAGITALFPKEGGTYYVSDPLQYLWDGTKTRFFGRFGLAADFRVNDAVSIGAELSANTLSDHYNSKKAGNTDWYYNLLVGAKIKFGTTYTTRRKPVREPEVRVVEKIVEKVVEPAPAPVTTATVAKVEPLRRDIFFKINSAVIAGEEASKVKDIADYLSANPTAKVTVTSYADAGTGTAAINKRMSERRTEAVVKALKEQYHVSADRITYSSEGSSTQPFAENAKNRVTICIAE